MSLGIVRNLILILILPLFLAPSFSEAAGNEHRAKVHRQHSKYTVIIENMVFNPKELTVQIGDTITWINKDLVPHTVTGTQNRFESGSISSGSKWSTQIKKEMFGDYRCSFHPAMTGLISQSK